MGFNSNAKVKSENRTASLDFTPCLSVFPGRMREVEVGNHKVLLVRSEGMYSAVGNLCTHYGATLSKGKTGLVGRAVCECALWEGICYRMMCRMHAVNSLVIVGMKRGMLF